jgi:hypothetical protein
VTEDQPQNNDHRNRHAKQPEQNSPTHQRLLTPAALRTERQKRA